MLRNSHFSYIVQNHSGTVSLHVLFMNTKRTQLRTIGFIKCSKAEIYSPLSKKLIPHLHFTKSLKHNNVYKLCL